MILVYRNVGANGLELAYEIYSISPSGATLLWKWEGDHREHSTVHAYSVSNVDLSELSISEASKISVYTTYGILGGLVEPDADTTPQHRLTIFRKIESTGIFMEQERRDLK
jgi:hypothetical protein